MTEETAARFSLRISRTTFSHGADEYRVRIVDEASRLLVVELSLNAVQFAEAVTGLNAAEVPGRMLPAASRGQLGMQMDHYSITLQASDEAAAEWAEKARVRLAANATEVTRTQGGKQVTFRWYRPVGSPPIDHVVAASLLPPRPAA